MKWTLFALITVCFAAIGCASPIVGASCREGYDVCADGCVDLQTDWRNCGACDNNCGRFLCEDGMCTSTVRPDAGVDEDAGVDAGESPDGGTFDPDGGVSGGGCGLGSLECDGVCTDVTRDVNRCGACDNRCASGEFCAYAKCWAECEGDLQFCGGVCLDTKRDPNNCGGCGNVCASGICIDGVCDDRVPGHVVVIGHDLIGANNAMRRIAGNAVFLSRGAPLRVLIYRGEAVESSVAGVDAALDFSTRELGRQVERIDAVDALVPLQLTNADVFLIHAQANATKSTLQKLGKQWANALAQFVARSGTVVLFEAPSSSNDGTFRILGPSRLFSASAREEIPEQRLEVMTLDQAVMLRVPDRYMSVSHSVHFSDVDKAATVLVADQDGEPVVLQRVIRAK